MRNLVLGSVALVCLCGCSRVHDVNPTADSGSLSRLNETVKGKQVKIELRDRSTRTGDGVHVRADTTFWYERGAVTDRSAVATSAVARISVRQRFGQAGHFAKRGLIGGGIAGTVAGLFVAGSFDYLVVSGALIGGGIGAALGAGAGVVTAFIFAQEEAFVFPEADTPGVDADR